MLTILGEVDGGVGHRRWLSALGAERIAQSLRPLVPRDGRKGASARRKFDEFTIGKKQQAFGENPSVVVRHHVTEFAKRVRALAQRVENMDYRVPIQLHPASIADLDNRAQDTIDAARKH